MADRLLQRLGGWLHREADQVSDSLNRWLHQEIDRLLASFERWLAEQLRGTEDGGAIELTPLA